MAEDAMVETPEDKAAMDAMREDAPPPAAPPAGTEPPPADGKQPPAAPHKPTRLVPHAALHEERQRRQALERELAELRRTPQAPAATTPVRPAAEQEIDENADPLGAIGQVKKALREEREQRERERKAFEDEQAGRRAMDELGRRVGERVNAYAAEHPEYPDQVKFLRNFRADQLKHLGMDDQSILRQIYQEEMSIGAMAVERDMDPGEIVAKLAQQAGWKAPKQEGAPATAAEEALDRLNRGRRIAKSPSAAGGGAPAAEMSLEDIAKLDGAAFDKAFSAHAKRLMG